MAKYLSFLLLITLACQHEKVIRPVPGVCTVGKIDRYVSFESPNLSGRTVDVWLPEGFSRHEKYAVLYMHDGQMLFYPEATWNKQYWEADRTLQRWMDADSIRKTIIVALWNSQEGHRHSDYFPEKAWNILDDRDRDSLFHATRPDGSRIFRVPVRSDAYLKFVVEDVKPFIDQNYPTRKDRKNTFIMGSSMGGLISIYALCEYPEVFGGAACLSTHWTGTYTDQNNPIPSAIVDYLGDHLPPPGNHRIYFDLGDRTLDTLYAQYQVSVDSVMLKKGYDPSNWVTRIFPGAEHTEQAWAYRLPIPVNFLLKN